jgi:hypothetical protein
MTTTTKRPTCPSPHDAVRKLVDLHGTSYLARARIARELGISLDLVSALVDRILAESGNVRL